MCALLWYAPAFGIAASAPCSVPWEARRHAPARSRCAACSTSTDDCQLRAPAAGPPGDAGRRRAEACSATSTWKGGRQTRGASAVPDTVPRRGGYGGGLDRDIGVRLPALARGDFLPARAGAAGRARLVRRSVSDRGAEPSVLPAAVGGNLRALGGGRARRVHLF